MTSPQHLQVGLIGLGTMGSAMARRLISAGLDPHLWNRSEERLQPFLGLKARVCSTAGMVIDRSDIVLLMLSDDEAVDAVLDFATDGSDRSLARKIIVNMGTGSPARALLHQAKVAACGGTYIEAPVSGSRRPAEEGRLLAMIAGGTSAERALVGSVIAPLCRASIDAGPVPQGLRTKLAVNHYLVTSVAALAEAFHLAERMQIEPARFSEVLAASPMASDVSIGKGQKIAQRDFSVEAAISDVHKNCRLVADAAQEAGAGTPLLERARALFAAQDGDSGPLVDMAAVIESFKGRDADASAGVVARQLDAYQRRDLASFMACWDDAATIIGHDGALVASGAAAIRERHLQRFRDPVLGARLVARTAVGGTVVDEELVRRTGAADTVEEVRVLAIYRVRNELIVSAAFAEEPAHAQ